MRLRYTDIQVWTTDKEIVVRHEPSTEGLRYTDKNINSIRQSTVSTHTTWLRQSHSKMQRFITWEIDPKLYCQLSTTRSQGGREGRRDVTPEWERGWIVPGNGSTQGKYKGFVVVIFSFTIDFFIFIFRIDWSVAS